MRNMAWLGLMGFVFLAGCATMEIRRRYDHDCESTLCGHRVGGRDAYYFRIYLLPKM